MNDVILNWKKLKRFTNPAKSGNEINGRKRHGKKITHDSYLIVKKFNLNLNEGSKDDSSVRQETFSKTGRSSRRPASTRDKKIL